MSMLVLCPSRGRPKSASQVLETFMETRTSLTTELYFIVDEDDPTIDEYPGINVLSIEPREKGMGPALNAGLDSALNDLDIRKNMYGFIGDDHRFRTVGWDERFLDNNDVNPGIYYANDGVRPDLPTQWFVDGPIVESLGWLALPDCKHFYLDDAWREIGNSLGILYYVGDVLIEHLHFTYGKSAMDATYERSQEIWKGGDDQKAYEAWRNGPAFDETLDLVRGALPL